MSIMDFLDWLHIGWRLRRQYLDPGKCLALGGMHITQSLVVREALAFGVGGADVDASNKQSYSGEQHQQAMRGVCPAFVSIYSVSIGWVVADARMFVLDRHAEAVRHL